MMQSTRKPLIAHVLFRLGTGGLENGLVNLINTLPDDKYRHAVICMTDYTDFRNRINSESVHVYCLNKKPGQDLAVYVRLWRLLRHIKPDILHTRNLSALEAQLPGFLAGVKCRIHGEHGRDIDDIEGTNWRYVMLRRFFRPLVQRYIPMSKDIEGWLIRQIKVPITKISQVYNGVDINRFQGGDKPYFLLPLAFRAPELVLIGTVGRLDPIKDQLTLIQAFIHLIKINPHLCHQVRLIVVGDGHLKSTLQDLARVAAVEHLIWFAGERQDVAEVMKTLDLFVLPSINEGISNTILEAMACALPVIATEVGGNPELVIDGQTGYLLDKQDPKAMAAAFKLYLDQPELLKLHGEAGRLRVVSMFSLSTMIAGYIAIYDKLLAENALN